MIFALLLLLLPHLGDLLIPLSYSDSGSFPKLLSNLFLITR